MEVNWVIFGIISIIIILLVLFTIIRNQKNKKEYTKFLNRDYKKPDEGNPEEEY